MKTLRAALAVMLALGLVLGLAGCSSDEVAATVNGEEIMKSELDEQVDKLKEQYPQMFEGADAEARLLDFQQRLLDNLINSVLIRRPPRRWASRSATPTSRPSSTSSSAGFQDEAAFEDALAQAGMTIETLETQIRDQLLTEALLEEIATGDRRSPRRTSPPTTRPTRPSSPRRQRCTHRTSCSLPRTRRPPRRSWPRSRTAATSSTCRGVLHDAVSAANGGDLGWPTTPYVPEFQAAPRQLEVGEVSGPGRDDVRLAHHPRERQARGAQKDARRGRRSDRGDPEPADQRRCVSGVPGRAEAEAEIVILIEGLELTR